jgi:DNA-binding NarL/FixJ family response regulator
MEVLGCLADSLSNGRIGAKLHISPKTVDHHVSSILTKLGVPSRSQATRIAREQHLLPKNREESAAK